MNSLTNGFHCLAIKRILFNQKTNELQIKIIKKKKKKIWPVLENEKGDGGRLVPLFLWTKSPWRWRQRVVAEWRYWKRSCFFCFFNPFSANVKCKDSELWGFFFFFFFPFKVNFFSFFLKLTFFLTLVILGIRVRVIFLFVLCCNVCALL